MKPAIKPKIEIIRSRQHDGAGSTSTGRIAPRDLFVRRLGQSFGSSSVVQI